MSNPPEATWRVFLFTVISKRIEDTYFSPNEMTPPELEVSTLVVGLP